MNEFEQKCAKDAKLESRGTECPSHIGDGGPQMGPSTGLRAGADEEEACFADATGRREAWEWEFEI